MTHSSKNRFYSFLVFAAFLLAPLPVVCSTIADYHSRIRTARNDVEAVIGALEAKSQPSFDGQELIRQALLRVRKALPVSESIDLGGATIETNNQWLQAELNKFDEAGDRQDEIGILSGISERLSSIDIRVAELEKTAAGTRTKDDDKQKLNEILSREEYQKPEDKGESIFQRWMNAFLKWLSDLFPKDPNMPKVDPSRLQPLSVAIQLIVYALVIGLIGFLIYKFAPVIAERFGRKEKKEKGSRVILGEHIDASRSASDLFAEAENFARSGDLRAAIRRGYIALLCDLADKKVIGLARHKTNRDYLRDVRKQEAVLGPMKYATGSFERHWYGFRTPDEKDWDEFREQYRSAINSQATR